MVAINPQRIDGRWHRGIALDFHTTSSVPLGPNEFGHMQFDTKRPEIAELLYRLKYKGDKSAAPQIIATAAAFLRPHSSKFDVIVPVPPSKRRPFQPVQHMARGIGVALDKAVVECVVATRATMDLKSVDDPEERARLLADLYTLDDPGRIGNKSILLFDDLYRSGATMNSITDLLLDTGGVRAVRVLTVTRTRSHQ